MKIILCVLCLIISYSVLADEVTNINTVDVGDEVRLSWNALGKRWQSITHRDPYLGQSIPIIELDVTSGNETLLRNMDNVFYRGTLLNYSARSSVYIDRSDPTVPFLGFVATESKMYLIEKDPGSSTGIIMREEQTANDVNDSDEGSIGNSGWQQGGSGGKLFPDYLVPRNRTDALFPSLDIYVDPSYREKVGADYLSRIIAGLTVANTMYQQSGLKQIHLLAIILNNEDISRSDSQGNIIHGLEKVRSFTAAPDSADGSIVLSGVIFSRSDLWGWSELGYGCALQIAVAEGWSVNTHTVGQASAAVIDLPSLLQRGWILAHEFGHILYSKHTYLDPIMYAYFQPELNLHDYVSSCAAKQNYLQTCAYNPQTHELLDYYSCN